MADAIHGIPTKSYAFVGIALYALKKQIGNVGLEIIAGNYAADSINAVPTDRGFL
jgi:hypothetical protein